MNLYKLDVKNKNTNLYCRLYILFISNQRKTTKKLITEQISFPTVFIPSPSHRRHRTATRLGSSSLPTAKPMPASSSLKVKIRAFTIN
jgi:hypothetical protein